MIEYIERKNSPHVIVKLDGRQVGKIKKVKEGYQYFPFSSKNGGKVYKTIQEIKNILE